MQNAFCELPQTRTVYVLGLQNKEDLDKFKAENVKDGNVHDIFTVGSSLVLFISFYDLREAQNFAASNFGEGIKIEHTISRYEIPKRGDDCTEKNMQASLNFLFKNADHPIEDDAVFELVKEYGDIHEIRNSKQIQKTVEFYDVRSARKAYEALLYRPYGGGVIKCRWVWDLSFATRNEYLRKTEAICNEFVEADQLADYNTKRTKLQESSEKNIFTRVFDEFIIENLAEIERMIRKS